MSVISPTRGIGRVAQAARRGISSLAQAEPTSIPFLQTLEGGAKTLPFKIPSDSFLQSGIGNTPLLNLHNNIFAKLEGHNPGGSVKDRTLSSIVMSMFMSGELKKNGDTLCLVTSGSAGMSLTRIHEALEAIKGVDLNVIVVMPTIYAKKQIPAEIIELECTSTFYDYHDVLKANKLNAENGKGGSVSVLLMDGVFMDVLTETKAIAKEERWVMLDQHYDAHSMDGHKSTALEIILQCPGVTDVVCATGTGATAAGLMKHLPDHIKVHARPAQSGSIDGLSDVDRYGNFCDTSKLKGYTESTFEAKISNNNLRQLSTLYNLEAGPSSGATYWLAKEIQQKSPEAKIVFICADGKIAETNDKLMRKSSLKALLSHRREALKTPAIRQQNTGGTPFMKPVFSSSCAREFGPDRNTRFASANSYSSLGFRRFSTARSFSTSPAAVPQIDSIVVGGGPVGGSAAWFLSEHEKNEGKSTMLIHDPNNKGAHEDWSRLARLSFDGPHDEFLLSQHAVSLLDMADEVRSYQSGEPVVPVRPGMLFLASPGTNLARACAHGLANFGDDEFKQVDTSELEALYPGNPMNLPADTLCFTHPVGLCVSPLELAAVGRGIAQGYGVDIKTSRVSVDMAPASAGPNMIRVTLETGEQYDTRRCFLFAGAQGKKIIADALARDPVANAPLAVPEFDETYITAISTVRYKHRNHPADPAPDSNHVPTPITLGQLNIPELCPHEANFSVVAEEYGDVLKTRLSGAAGAETIDTVAELHQDWSSQDAELKDVYGKFFGTLFPYLECEKPLDFNRCVTYRSHNTSFSGTSLLEKVIGEGADSASLMTTPGCFGVGVKFGPALGQAAAAHTYSDDLEEGMRVFTSGSEELQKVDDDAERVERAW